MTENERREALCELGAEAADIDVLLEYAANAFSPRESGDDEDEFLQKWEPVLETARFEGAAETVNKHLVADELQIVFESPETLHIELFPSIGGIIPLITTESTADFESMVINIVRKGKPDPNIGEQGASFAFGKTNRFIILSNKPYSNVSAERMGLSDAEWREKSMIIRKHHECAHYYTKRYMGSSRNNLHDELIADFCGLYAAFGEYKAEWFLRFLKQGRIKLYTQGMSDSAAGVVLKLAENAAKGVEAWSKTDDFAQMSETERIRCLCGKELLAYV